MKITTAFLTLLTVSSSYCAQQESYAQQLTALFDELIKTTEFAQDIIRTVANETDGETAEGKLSAQALQNANIAIQYLRTARPLLSNKQYDEATFREEFDQLTEAKRKSDAAMAGCKAKFEA